MLKDMTPEDRNCSRCGGPVSAADEDLCSKCTDETIELESQLPRIPGHRIIHLLGVGGMGRVYLAEDEALGRLVAVKLISRDLSQDREAHKRFVREARNLARIEHPNIVRVYSFGASNAGDYFAMEYVNGTGLEARLREGPLPVADSIRVVRQCVEALDAALKEGVIHRDIKPANILLDQHGNVRVADFGLAKSFRDSSQDTSSLTGSRRALGTPKYIAPEQARGDPVDFRADIYSLGVVWYELLTGEPPFRGRTPFAIVEQHLRADFPSAKARRPDIPDACEELIRWMAAKDPECRPATYEVLKSAIERAVDSDRGGPEVRKTAATARKPIKRKKRSWRILSDVGSWISRKRQFVLALTTAAVVALAWLVGSPQDVTPGEGAEKRFRVAITPFYGPDAESTKEGRLMGAMIERAARARFEPMNIEVIGIEETAAAVRSHEAARVLGEKLESNVVVWGEAFSLRGESEISPHFTFVPRAKDDGRGPGDLEDWLRPLGTAARSEQITEFFGGPEISMLVGDGTTGQIELRRTSAEGINDMVLLLAAVHALVEENDAQKARDLLDLCPESVEVLRLRGQALLAGGERQAAVRTIQEAVSLTPTDAQNHALLGDIALESGDVSTAFEEYSEAERLQKPFTSAFGAVFQGFFLTLEITDVVQPYGVRKVFGPYLLVRDPLTLRVLARHRLPGKAYGFHPTPGGLEVRYRSHVGSRYFEFETLKWNPDGFDKPLWPGPVLFDRDDGIRCGLNLAANFLDRDWLSSQPAVLRDFTPKMSYSSLPTTHPELDAALTSAMAEDPTQAWYPLLLGLSSWSQGDTISCKTYLDQALATNGHGNPYYEYSWMALLLEEHGLPSQADAAFERALQLRRSSPQPVGMTTVFELNFNAPFLRAARGTLAEQDPQRAYQWLHRARLLTGEEVVSGDLEAAAWQKHAAREDDWARASFEQERRDRIRQNPFNVRVVSAQMAYLLVLIAALFLGLISLLICVRVEARLRRLHPSLDHQCSAQMGIRNRWMWFAGGGAMAFSLFGILLTLPFLGALIFEGAEDTHTIFFVGLLFLYLGLTFMLDRPGADEHHWENQTKNDARCRRLLGICVLGLLLVAACLILPARSYISRQAFGSVGWADSLGHAEVVSSMERRIKDGADESTIFVAAVVNHLAGNLGRAEHLYRSIPNHRGAREIMRSFGQPGPVPPVLTAEELFHAFQDNSDFQNFVREGVAIIAIATTFLLLLAGIVWSLFFGLAMMLYCPVSAASRGILARWVGAASGLLLPGIHDFHVGSRARAISVLMLALVPVMAVACYLMSASFSTPNYPPTNLLNFGHAVLPPSFLTEEGTLTGHAKWALVSTLPGFIPVAFLIVASTAAAAYLHAQTVRAILTEGRGKA